MFRHNAFLSASRGSVYDAPQWYHTRWAIAYMYIYKSVITPDKKSGSGWRLLSADVNNGKFYSINASRCALYSSRVDCHCARQYTITSCYRDVSAVCCRSRMQDILASVRRPRRLWVFTAQCTGVTRTRYVYGWSVWFTPSSVTVIQPAHGCRPLRVFSRFCTADSVGGRAALNDAVRVAGWPVSWALQVVLVAGPPGIISQMWPSWVDWYHFVTLLLLSRISRTTCSFYCTTRAWYML